jgi:hypothetical protein
MALRGPHHFLGVANSVGDMIFHNLQSRCQTAGGSLTAADLEDARSHFVHKLPQALEFFSMINQTCMEASAATAPDSFARDSVLATLLMACGQKPARRAFDMQMGRFGNVWLAQFFNGLAIFVRERVPTADARLIKAYAVAAVKFGAKLSIPDLFKQDAILATLRECLAPLVHADAASDLAAPLSDQVSVHIATQRGIPKPDLSKVTDQQMRNFLTWLPPQAMLVLSGAPGAFA